MTKKNKHEDPKVEEVILETNDAVESETTNETIEEVAAESSELEVLKAELATKNDALLRTIAEYSNYRKRVEKEKQDLIKYGHEKIMTDMLQIVDNFERALSSMDKDNEVLQPVVNGVEMIKKNFDDLMVKYGVSEVEAMGQEFNPEAHHAVMTGESESAESNTVIEIFQKGYKLHEKIIRPAMVKVAE